MDSALSNTLMTHKILKFNHCKQDSDKIFAKFFANVCRIPCHSVIFLNYGIKKSRWIDRVQPSNNTSLGLAFSSDCYCGDRRVDADTKLKMREVVKAAEELVLSVMGKWDASHDAFHALRVRKLALTLAAEEQLPPESMEIVELASLLHDIGDHKYASDESECKVVERFLESHGVESVKRDKILSIINRMGFKDELAAVTTCEFLPEFGVVQDADRLDAIGAIGIARCLTFGGSRNRVLHDPEVNARINLTKEEYIKQDVKQTTMNHFHEKLLKLKDLMKTEAGRRRAERRHKFMQDFLTEFYEEWEGNL